MQNGTTYLPTQTSRLTDAFFSRIDSSLFISARIPFPALPDSVFEKIEPRAKSCSSIMQICFFELSFYNFKFLNYFFKMSRDTWQELVTIQMFLNAINLK